MRYTKHVAKPTYNQLIELFDERFEKTKFEDINNCDHSYYGTLRLKINLRMEIKMNFEAKFELLEKGLLTCIDLSIKDLKILVLSLLMFASITLINYVIHPSFFALITGLIAGSIVYIMAEIQLKREVERYLNDLCSIKRVQEKVELTQ